MASPSSKAYELDLTVVSAKNLKNVNWSNGTLRPYAAVWLNPQHHQLLHAPSENVVGAIRPHPVRLQLQTRPDNDGGTSPVWNHRIALPVAAPLQESFLSVDVLHHNVPFAPCKPLVASLRLPLHSFLPVAGSGRTRTFELVRPSGRPQGKIRLKFALRQRNHAFYVSSPAPAPAGFPGGIAPTWFHMDQKEVQQSGVVGEQRAVEVLSEDVEKKLNVEKLKMMNPSLERKKTNFTASR